MRVAGDTGAVADGRRDVGMVGRAIQVDEHARERAGVERNAERLREPRGDLVGAVVPARLRAQDLVGDAEVDAGRQRPRRVLARQHDAGHDRRAYSNGRSVARGTISAASTAATTTTPP